MIKTRFTILFCKLLNNVMALTTDAPVGKHQRELVSQVKVKLNPANFSKTHVFRIKIFDRRSLSSTNSARRLQTEHYPSCEPASSYYSRATTVDGLHILEPKNTCRCCDPSSAQSKPNSSGTLVEP